MSTHIPSAAELRERLALMGHAQVQALAARAHVPFTTLWKIRTGETADPRLETVRAIWPELIETEGAPAVPEPAKEGA
jgi:predicted transcriptional regulator